MPELPEVETTRRGLIVSLEGTVITKVIKRRNKIRILIPDDFEKRIEGHMVLSIRRRAKYLQIFLSNGDVIICHLGMSGKFVIRKINDGVNGQENNTEFDKHDHVIFETKNSEYVIYNDPRRFGVMTICAETDLETHPLFKDMAVEPLGNEFNGDYLCDKLLNKNSPIKTVLLDQRIVVGLGNIYVCEALNIAKISPVKKACALRVDEVERLVPIIRNVLNRAIEAGGSSLKDFAKVDGDLGYFQHQFVSYGRENKPCKNDNCKGNIDRIIQSGRSTFYCPICQI